MKIIYEDDNNLNFVVYPEKIILIIYLFILIGSVTGYIYSNNDIFRIISIVFFLVTIVSIFLAYRFPIQVIIDKSKDSLSYRNFTIFPNKLWTKINDNYNPTIKFKISEIQKLVLTNDLSDSFTRYYFFSNGFDPTVICHFVFKDNKTVDIHPDSFLVNQHYSAFLKITQYLKLSFEDKRQY